MAYYGETECQASVKSGDPCRNKAYYFQNDRVLCGRHSKKELRVELQKNPHAAEQKKDKLVEERRQIEAAASENRSRGQRGQVIVTPLRMMKAPKDHLGYLKVFPNFKHGNRSDGYGCPALSPMSLGPVTHLMPNLPPAKNIENFHQFAKVFPFEVDAQGQLLPQVISHRVAAYNDPVAHRHKYDREVVKQYKPLYSVYYDSQEQEHRFSYIGSRYFYCKKYEELASRTHELECLRDLLAAGYNLQIVGYDGYPVMRTLLEHYVDESLPFGHELVLYTLLTASPETYPWNQVYQVNEALYKGVGI
jgi:hypothetical protein